MLLRCFLIFAFAISSLQAKESPIYYVSFFWIKDYNYAKDTGNSKRIYDVGFSANFDNNLQVDIAATQSNLLYNFNPEKRIRFFTGIQYNYDHGFLLPLGFNFNIGHWFGAKKDRVVWSERLVLDVIGLADEPTELRYNFAMSFGLKIKVG